MFDFEDFEKDEDFYKNLDFNIEDIDFGDFPSCLMIGFDCFVNPKFHKIR